MNISSPAFGHKQPIPARYTCEDKNVSPPLTFSNVPGTTTSLTLIMYDPEAPSGSYTHWTVFNMPANTNGISENTVPSKSSQGSNSAGRSRYDGPCPPSGTHRYIFKLYALDNLLHVGSGASKQALESAMHGHILDRAELIGIYHKANQ
jgi:Raf kinase inhibitor-like YbhB/YbcL family protein